MNPSPPAEPTPRARPEVRGYEPADWPAYEVFANRFFGAGRRYRDGLRWLYEEHPAGGQPSDLMVALVEGEVVGCLHRIRLPWSRAGEAVEVPSYHNLVVAPEHRRGVGLVLLQKLFAQDRFALLAGANDLADAIYDKMGLAPLPLWWHRKLLSPPRVLLQVARTRLTRQPPSPRPDRQPWSQGDHAFEVIALDQTGALPDGDAERLAESLALPPQAEFHLVWTPELYRWRFFHRFAPRHLTVLLREQGEVAGRVTVALVRQSGWLSGHVMDLAWRRPELRGELLAAAGRVLQRSGVHAMHLITGEAEPAEELVRTGWQRLSGCANARFYARKKAYDQLPGGLWSGVWDGGLPPGAPATGVDG